MSDRQTDVKQHHRLMPQPMGLGHNNFALTQGRSHCRKKIGKLMHRRRYLQAVRVATQYASATLQVANIFAFIRQVAGLFRHVGYLGH